MTKKEELCLRLSQYEKESITREDIIIEGFRGGLSENSAILAWNNYIQTSVPDRRATNGGKTGEIKMISSYNPEDIPTKKGIKTKKEAAGIILEYMKKRELTSRDIAIKHNITVKQFYSWIKELNVSGKLLGKKILNPLKYHKCEVKDVIWLKKVPTSQRKGIRKLNILEYSFYKRTGNVLETYLKKI